MWILSAVALYILVRSCARAAPRQGAGALRIVLESLALVLLVIWRTVGAATRMHRF
jgi:hypothetical protein